MRSMMDAITSSETFICDGAPCLSARTWRKFERLLLNRASAVITSHVSSCYTCLRNCKQDYTFGSEICLGCLSAGERESDSCKWIQPEVVYKCVEIEVPQ